MPEENPRAVLVRHILHNKHAFDLLPYLLDHSISPPEPFYVRRAAEDTSVPVSSTHRLFDLLYGGDAIRYYTGRTNPFKDGQEGKTSVLYERCGPLFWEGVARLIDYTRG